MGRYVIKAAPDRDLYMEWSTIVEAPVFIGNRDEMVANLRRQHQPDHEVRARMLRADETGTSALCDSMAPGYTGPLDGEWGDTGLIVEQRGWLRRDRFAEFLDAYVVDPETAYTLLDPLEDES